MPTKLELLQAIEDIKKEKPTFQGCERMAALYTVLANLYPEEPVRSYEIPMYSGDEPDTFPEMTGSELRVAISGQPIEKIIRVLDEHMKVVQVIMPKEYRAVIEKMSE